MMLFLRGCRICLCTMPSTVSRSIPSASAAWKAASRFGPGCRRCPHAPACGRSRTSHERGLAGREVGLVATAGAQRQSECDGARAPPARPTVFRARLTGREHYPLEGLGRSVDHALGHALPGVAAGRLGGERGAGALALGGVELEPGHELRGDLPTAPGRHRTTSAGAVRSGSAGASVAVTSAMPEWSADSGSAPQAAASAATIPNDSGKVRRHHLRLAGGQQERAGRRARAGR